MGIHHKPKTKSESITVADALFTKSQQRVLALIFGNSGRSFYANEIISLAGIGTGAVQRELAKLEMAGLVTASRIGNQKHFQANMQSAVFQPLRELILKTSGLTDVLRAALEPIGSRIRAAFVYGSVAKGQDSASSDIDLMIVSEDVTYSDLFEVLESTSRQIGRAVNPTIYSPAEIQKRIHARNSFVTRVLKQPKIWLIGDEHDLSAR